MRKQAKKAVIILFWLIVWQIAALCIDNPILLVGPAQVLTVFGQNVVQPDFIRIVLSSFTRIGLGFFLALFVGMLLGAVSYRFPVVEDLLSPVVQTVKSIPVASFVVLLLIWFGSRRLSFFISFLIVFPNVYVNMIAGLKSADNGLLEMAKVFHIGRGKRFFYIYRPAMMPYLNSCLKISLGMSWKSGVAAEVIGLPGYSMGERLYMSKIYLDTAGLFAWTLTVILVSFLFEKAVLWIVREFAEWKPYPGVHIRTGGEQ
ncbi:MAG: ABC transporter permease subunit, partial [Eubacterium sp.]|nr:ABC transporter permease subunit [Eubacterium sp.]